MPSPINAVRTRVIDTGSGYVAQMSVDGMMWYDLPDPIDCQTGGDWLADIKYYATRVALSASQLPSTGTVVWKSDAK